MPRVLTPAGSGKKPGAPEQGPPPWLYSECAPPVNQGHGTRGFQETSKQLRSGNYDEWDSTGERCQTLHSFPASD